MRRLTLVPAALLLLCPVGCGDPAARYHGDWTANVVMDNAAGTGTLTLSPDGSYVLKLNLSPTVPGMSGLKGTINDSGTWKLMEKDQLQFTVQSQSWTLDGVPPALKSLIEGGLESMKNGVKQAMANPIPVTWEEQRWKISAGSARFTFQRNSV